MPICDLNGLHVAYEVIGDGPRSAAITPGGRTSKDTPGVRELAQELAKDGFRTLIWDRPNTGASDFCFSAPGESQMHADTLLALLDELDMTPAFLIGGSAGARVTLLAAITRPELVERVSVLWLSSGALCLAFLATYYYHDAMVAAAQGGMTAVAEVPMLAEPLASNPRNRDLLLSQDPEQFIRTMKRWGEVMAAPGNALLPGLSPDDLAKLTMPLLVFNGGRPDIHHPRETTEALHAAVPGSLLVDPPWGEREWLDRLKAQEAGAGFFERWPLLAPQLLEFASRG